ncbi:MAG: Nif-specific regulatory protein [Smithella sp. PtaU1.Bin162]|nr:MAG: Nif-specific regulatory protein [Smithella sp. PtaU1.Bin162]
MNSIIIDNLKKQVDDFYSDTGYQKMNIKVRDYMYSNPFVLKTDARLKDAIDLIIRNSLDAVPIVDDYDNVVGIITKTLALREVNRSGDINKSVKDVMRTNPATTTPDEDSLNLLRIPIGSIPVVENGHLTGIVNLSDTIRACFSSILLLQEELKTIINSAYSGIITTDNNNYIRFINPAAEKILNVTNKELMGKLIADFFPDLKMQEVTNTGKTVFSKKLFFRNRILIANISQLRNKEQIIGAVALFQDISDLENISEELKYTKELKNEVDAIIESSFDGIYLTNTFGKILRVNNAFTRITGISKEELIYKTIAELVDIGIFLQPLPLDDILKGKPVTTFQEVRTGKSILVTSNPIFDNRNDVVRIVHNVRDITELNNLKDQLEKAESLSQHYRDQLEIIKLPSKYVAKSNKSKALIDLIMRLSKIDATVLLLGESGVGKDVVAEMLHENSPRKDKLLITVNCAAIPDNLLESELFGYEPGAFTGASKKGKIGAFELANGSTLFLDEIGEMPLNLQSKILRVLQKKEITKVGGQATIKLDVRILAATNRDLEAMVADNSFRGDLYYRLSVVPVVVPPLRERKEEIPDLVFHFVQMFNNKYGFNKHFDDRVIYEFLDYDWPGNIRELENVIERCMITSADNIIHNADFLSRRIKSSGNEPGPPAVPPDFNYKYALENFEKEMITNALARFGTTRKAAAELGISQPTIVRKAAKYKIKMRE